MGQWSVRGYKEDGGRWKRREAGREKERVGWMMRVPVEGSMFRLLDPGIEVGEARLGILE
jgi:hypothetical protein